MTIDDFFVYRKKDSVLQDIDTSLGKGVLFIIEGYDELPEHLRERNSLFSDLISGRSLPCATVLVTSRPSATGNLKHGQRQRMTQHIEILGFTKEQVQLYLRSVLTEEKDLKKLKQYLELRPQIHAAMYIPLNAAIVVLIYQESEGGELPETMTELYTSLTKSILIRFLYGASDGHKRPRLKDFSDLPIDTHEKFLKLCKLAYDGICNNQQLIFSDLPEDFETLGFMQSVTELYVDQGESVSYNFLHLTIQEFLAAFHIFKQLPEKWTEHFEKYQNDSHFKVTLRFLAGLTKLESVTVLDVNVGENKDDDDYFDYVNYFKDYLKQATKIRMHIVHWLFEAQNPSGLEQTMKSTKVKFSLGSCQMPLDFYILGYCIRSYFSWHLDIKQISEEDLDLLTLGYNAGNSKGCGVVFALSKHEKSENVLQRLLVLFSVPYLEIEMYEEDLQVLSTSHSLNILKISKTSKVEFRKTLKVVSGMNTLKHLDSKRFPSLKLSPSSITCLASILSQNQSPLTGLYLGGCYIHTQDAVEMFQSLSDTSNLTHLTLSWNPIDDEGVIALARKIAQGSLHLTELDLSLCDIGEHGAVELVQALCSVACQTISTLDLSHNPLIGDTAATDLARLLENSSSTLTQLGLYDCAISPQGGAQIAQALCSNTTLKKLDMSLSTLNMDILATLLQLNSSLTHLKLHWCDIQIQDPEQLLKLVCSNPNSKLEVLIVSNNPVTSDVPEDVFQSYKPKSLKKLVYTFKDDLEQTTYTITWRNQEFDGKTYNYIDDIYYMEKPGI